MISFHGAAHTLDSVGYKVGHIICLSNVQRSLTHEAQTNWFVWGLVPTRSFVQISTGGIENGNHLWGN